MSVVVHVTTVHARDDVRIVVKELATIARHTSHEPVLVVADGRGGSTGPGAVGVRDIGPLGGTRLRRFVQGTIRAFREVRRLRPRIVHFHDPELIPLGLALRLTGCRVIYDVHEDLPRQVLSKHWIAPRMQRAVASGASVLEWVAGRCFNGIAAATPAIAARFPADKRALVPNYPILEELALPDARAHADRPLEFAYVGGIAHVRGAGTMVAATQHLDAPVRLHFAGRFDRHETLAELSRMPGWQSVVNHGHIGRSEIARLLAQVRGGLVVLQPLRSYMEAWPIKMFEYMAAGLPVIASDFPIWRAIIEPERCGILVDPRDPAAIAGAMRWIIEHPDAAEEMGRRGRHAVEQRYNWRRAAEPLLALYTRIDEE